MMNKATSALNKVTQEEDQPEIDDSQTIQEVQYTTMDKRRPDTSVTYNSF